MIKFRIAILLGALLFLGASELEAAALPGVPAAAEEPAKPEPIDPPDSTLPIEEPQKAPPVKDPEPV